MYSIAGEIHGDAQQTGSGGSNVAV